MTILYKAIYRFGTILIKIPKAFIIEIKETVPTGSPLGPGNGSVIWFKILPEIKVTAVCSVISGTATEHIHIAYYPYQWGLMQRDRPISGINHYCVSKGLENIN
ncbi:unnamed protein product [Nyctereutes procyonoides]|uniref:(raccoon dog) hypothetical protein n=1 Tax=Nyctereutes procyonoides TaxID=34880 RepID=A0A811ZVY4_NYCPR|nr:unnamed protein product [Nyctereutes procyonoides]